MVSDTCRNITFRVYNFGYQLGIFPGIFNYSEMRIKTQVGRRIYAPWNPRIYINTSYISLVLCFIFQLFWLFYCIGFLIFCESTALDICFALVLIGSLYMTITAQLFLVLPNFVGFCIFVNSFLELDLQFRK